MNRFISFTTLLSTRRSHGPFRVGAVVLALALVFAVVGWTANFLLVVASVSLSPAEITTGGSSTGTVTLNPTPTSTVTVQLASSNPAAATVPASVTIAAGKNNRAFQVQSVSGASGCTQISAQVAGSAAQRALLIVRPPATPSGSPVRLSLSATQVVGGSQSLTGTVRLSLPLSGGSETVQLSSSNPALVTVPASVSVTIITTESGELAFKSFPISTAVTDVPTCAVITATRGNSTSRVLLKVVSISG